MELRGLHHCNNNSLNNISLYSNNNNQYNNNNNRNSRTSNNNNSVKLSRHRRALYTSNIVNHVQVETRMSVDSGVQLHLVVLGQLHLLVSLLVNLEVDLVSRASQKLLRVSRGSR